MRECVLLTSGAAPLTAADPLRWVPSLGGYRLVGSHLPTSFRSRSWRRSAPPAADRRLDPRREDPGSRGWRCNARARTADSAPGRPAAQARGPARRLPRQVPSRPRPGSPDGGCAPARFSRRIICRWASARSPLAMLSTQARHSSGFATGNTVTAKVSMSAPPRSTTKGEILPRWPCAVHRVQPCRPPAPGFAGSSSFPRPGAVTSPCPAQAPPPNSIAAEPDGRRVLSRAARE